MCVQNPFRTFVGINKRIQSKNSYMFSKETYQNRRKVLANTVSDGVMIFLGNVENPMNFADNPYPFRQDSTFLYYFGIQEPKLAAAIDANTGESIVFGDELDIDAIVWMGSQETIASKSERSGVVKTLPFAQLFDYVQQAKSAGRTVHVLPEYQPVNQILQSKLLGARLGETKPSVQFIKAIGAQRSVKEAQEVTEIEKAVHISNEMHLLAMRLAKPGMKEFELVNAIQHLSADAQCGFSYPPIMTVDGQILHNHYRLNTLKKGDMVLNDSGVEMAMGYAADLTRTFPVDKQFTARQRELYTIVHKAFKEAPAIMKPGVNFKEVHRKAALTLVEGLTEVGLMKGNPEEAVANNAHTMFFQCGTGHYMGLDVHDMENLGEQYIGYTEDDPKDQKTFGWKSLRLGRPLAEGNVVTVEPGIYIIPQLIDMWQAEKKNEAFINYDKLNEYRDFGGIRIEDDFLITKDGYKLLGEGLISTVDEVEAYRAEHLS